MPSDRIRNNLDYVGLGFQTISHEIFNKFYDLFILDGKKIISDNLIIDYVSPITLAYWFMDDGGKTDYRLNGSRGLDLHTSNFSDQSVNLMAMQLSQKFNIKCWKAYNRHYPIIRISGKDYNKVLNLIRPYVIDSMLHKLPRF